MGNHHTVSATWFELATGHKVVLLLVTVMGYLEACKAMKLCADLYCYFVMFLPLLPIYDTPASYPVGIL